MGRKNDFVKQIRKVRMGLLVSLPRNDATLARAAAEGGADGLKVHLNVRHAASGNDFGSFAEERERIGKILEAAGKVSVGIMPGAETVATAEELGALRDMGVRFYDIYLQHMPAAYLEVEGLAGMPAIGTGYRPETVEQVGRLGFELLEMSAAPHERYGQPLMLEDLAEYAGVCAAFPGVVVVPTQKAIRPEEVEALADAGVRCLMIGKIVTGDTPETLEAATAAFRSAIDRLG